MQLTVITFLFSQPRKWWQLGFGLYAPAHVNALARAVAANLMIPHRFLCLTDERDGFECETAEVWPAIRISDGEDGCYRRLHAFDSEWQRSLDTEWILQLDLDAVFLGDITSIVEDAMQAAEFTILGGSSWPDGTLCAHYNGSMWLCRAGARPWLWDDFDPELFYHQREAYRMPGNNRRPHGSDQAWITVRSGDTERTWGPEHGIRQYRTLQAPDNPPSGTKLLFFAGRMKPWSLAVKRRSPSIYEAWLRYAPGYEATPTAAVVTGHPISGYRPPQRLRRRARI